MTFSIKKRISAELLIDKRHHFIYKRLPGKGRAKNKVAKCRRPRTEIGAKGKQKRQPVLKWLERE